MGRGTSPCPTNLNIGGFMIAFLEFIAITFAIFVLIGGVAKWACLYRPAARNYVAFFIACGSSYAAGFGLDLVRLAVFGKIPSANAMMPILIWLSCSISSYFLARTAATKSIVLATPFGMNAALALFAAFLKPVHFFVAIPLALIALLTLTLPHKMSGG